MSTENVVKTTDVVQKKEPKSFNDLNKAQLVEAARYFGTLEEGNIDVLKADLHENGVSWEQYYKAFINKDAVLPEEPEELFNKVGVEDWEDSDEVQVEPVTAPEVPVLTQDKYLIKMVRENPYFEFKHYKFTQEKPYAIMSAADAQEILQTERDFRQAFPDELKEYYS